MSNCQLDLEYITSGEIKPVEEMHYEPVDCRYRAVQLVFTVLGYLSLAAAALLLLLLDERIWVILAECVILVAMVVNVVIVRKAWLFKGYALREYDITYRSGVIFPTVTTIPYGRMQQVSVKQNPISRFFNLYSVEVVNGAQQLSSLTIPGLTEEKATLIKSIVIERLRYDQD